MESVVFKNIWVPFSGSPFMVPVKVYPLGSELQDVKNKTPKDNANNFFISKYLGC
jgi:hypothetical protein